MFVILLRNCKGRTVETLSGPVPFHEAITKVNFLERSGRVPFGYEVDAVRLLCQ